MNQALLVSILLCSSACGGSFQGSSGGGGQSGGSGSGGSVADQITSLTQSFVQGLDQLLGIGGGSSNSGGQGSGGQNGGSGSAGGLADQVTNLTGSFVQDLLQMLGLGGGSGSGGGNVTMSFWHNATTGPGKAFWDKTVADFQAAHPNVKINVQAIQNEDLDGKLQTHFVITLEGTVKQPKVVKKGTSLKSDALRRCVETVLSTMVFPRPPDSKDHPVEYPFNLKAVR